MCGKTDSMVWRNSECCGEAVWRAWGGCLDNVGEGNWSA